ncbi:phage tail spike protein [Desulfoscipio geothermicus]|uniref:Phage minor structural protein, N-terminal region n=1 Tax=Desulfoscipio geothermicus DSM 3669 TaxID=1121426 RepID=A0A1I6EGC9_9FIRM|nr:phage tail protein [Desulfoscipio geothermicus]SFR16806.1 phage minor structural protein, N-terminal region [Desulfoscipio geothermicus DSM 3669]
MLYIFNQEEKLQAVLNASDMPGRYQEVYQYDQGHQYDTGLQYKKWSDKDPCPYWDAVHREALNGENTFTFTVPAGHPFAQYVTEGNLVAFKDLDADFQLFEIKRVTDIHGDGLTRTAFCEHAFYELLDDFIEDVRPTDTSANFALTQALSGTRWEVGTVADLGTNSTNYYYENALSAVQKVVSVWGGELRFRVVVTGGVISGRYVDLLARRGKDTGKQWEYGRHIQSIEREIDLTTTKTALYGRGKGVETEAGGFGRRLTFADVEWSVANGDPVDKPLGQEWVGDPDALAQWGRPGGRHRFGTFEDSEETDPEALLQKTWDELQELKTPRATYRMTVLDLERLSGYSHEKVRLGDTTRCIDRKFSPELLVEARVIEIDRDLLRPENTKITMGNFFPTLADDVLVQRQINRTVSAAFSPSTGKLATAWLDGKIDVLTNQLQATTSNWYTDDNGNIVFETQDGTAAMMLTGNGFMLSNEKDGNGAWIWRTFGTGDGFTADEINVGELNAALVKIVGNSYFYWDGDYLYIVDPADQNKQIRLSKEGIRFTGDGGQTWTVAISVDGIMADAINAITLSAISANLGEITAGYLKFQDPGVNQGIELWAGTVLKLAIGLLSSGKIGVKIADGEVYSTIIRSGAEGATTYVALLPDNELSGFYEGKKVFELVSGGYNGNISVYANEGSSEERVRMSADYGRDGVSYGVIQEGYNSTVGVGIKGPYSGIWVDPDGEIEIDPYDGTGKYCKVLGNFAVIGGAKDAIQETLSYGQVHLSVRESPDVRFVDEGKGELVNGECKINLDPIFLECIEPDAENTPWFIRLTPYGDFCLKVDKIGADYFIVRQVGGGTDSGQFVWILSAVRKGYAGRRFEKEQDPATDPVLTSNWEDELI